MVEPEAVAALLRLRALGWGSRRIARELGISRGTVKRYVEAGGWQPFRKPVRRKLLDDLDDWLRERFRRHRGNADVVRQELAAEKGIVASLRTVQRAVEPYRQELLAEARATVRFETARGRPRTAATGHGGCGRRPQRAGSCRSTSAATPWQRAAMGTPGKRLVEIAGRKVKVFLFVATLGYSRRLHVRAFRDERQESWFDGMATPRERARVGTPAWRVRSWPSVACRRRCSSTIRGLWSASTMPRIGRSSSTPSSWPSPATGASGRAPARPIGRGPRARPSPTPCKQACMGSPRMASATSSAMPLPAAAL